MNFIEEREKKPFESFEDMKTRLKSIPDPKKAVLKILHRPSRMEKLEKNNL